VAYVVEKLNSMDRPSLDISAIFGDEIAGRNKMPPKHKDKKSNAQPTHSQGKDYMVLK
jgi:hypothetical protein